MQAAKMKRVALRGATLLLAAQMLGLGSAIADETPTSGRETGEIYQLEAVTVTAEKRPAALQDVPASISAVTGDQIDDAGIQSITEIANQVPNLHISTWGGRRNSHVFMRGVGATYGEPAVGFYVDGVGYTGDGMFDMDLFDVERVEVLRGPQGTLYGRNALAGVINIVTRQPTNETEARVSAGAGNFGQRELKGSLRTPLVEDQLFLGLSASATKRDGYVDNTHLGEKADDRDDQSLRANLRWTPTADLDATLSLDAERFRGGAYPLGPLQEIRGHPDRVRNDFAGHDNRDAFGSSLSLNWNAPGVRVTSITGWRDWENDGVGDTDGSPLDIVQENTQEDRKQLTQELRLASPETESALRWMAGLYYYQEDTGIVTRSRFGSDAVAMGFVPAPMDSVLDADKDDQGYALFGQLDYRITDHVTLTAGLRRDHDKRRVRMRTRMEMGGTPVPGSEGDLNDRRVFKEWLPKIALAYKPDANILWYANAAKGYRAGGFNTLMNVDPADANFDPEHSINYEAGLKWSGWQKRLSFNLALFRVNLTDQQVIQLTPSIGSVVRNAGESHSQGLEAELVLRPAPGWDVNAGYSYTDARFDKYRDDVRGADYAGNRVPLVPRQMFNLAVQNRRPIGASAVLFSRLELQRIGDFHWDTANTLKQGAYNLVNLRLGVEGDNWEAYLWGKNLLDEGYAEFAYDFPGLGPRAQAGRPRTFGVTVSARF